MYLPKEWRKVVVPSILLGGFCNAIITITIGSLFNLFFPNTEFFVQPRNLFITWYYIKGLHALMPFPLSNGLHASYIFFQKRCNGKQTIYFGKNSQLILKFFKLFRHSRMVKIFSIKDNKWVNFCCENCHS